MERDVIAVKVDRHGLRVGNLLYVLESLPDDYVVFANEGELVICDAGLTQQLMTLSFRYGRDELVKQIAELSK